MPGPEDYDLARTAVTAGYTTSVQIDECLDLQRKAEAIQKERDAAKRLVLLSRAEGANPALLASLATEAAGHPLFIDELVRHAAQGHRGVFHLDDALWTRIQRLEDRVQSLLELIAIAGHPVPQERDPEHQEREP
jgi:hypothetical protein